MTVTFEVVGTPSPQGSKRLINGALIETSRNLKPWRAAVASAARDAANGHPFSEGPLELSVVFRFPMPASRKAAIRAAGIAPKVSAPDLDKLVRSVGDALKEGGLIIDDARITRIEAMKFEVTGWTGCTITVRQFV